MLSQESQKMCFECSVAIKCEILKNFKIQTFKIYKFKLKLKLLNVLNHQNSTWDFCTLQTLFPPLKIDIFCRIVPLSFVENSSKLSLKFLGPCKRCFLLWKLTFSVASSPLFFIKNMKWKLLEKFVPCKRWFSLWKSPFSDASPPYYLPMFPTNYAHMFPTNYAQTSPNRISPSRNSLCRENRIRGARAARMAGCAE